MTWPLRLVLCWVLRSHDQGSWHMPKHMWWPEYISISFNIIRTQRRSIASKMKHTLTWTAFFPAFEPFAPNESAPAVATSALMVILLVPSIVLSLYGMIIDETVKDESSKISNDRRQRHCYYWCKLLVVQRRSINASLGDGIYRDHFPLLTTAAHITLYAGIHLWYFFVFGIVTTHYTILCTANRPSCRKVISNY